MDTATGANILDFVGSLAVVIAAIVVCGWLYSRSRSFGATNASLINVIASKALGSKERLIVVEVAGKQLLVGMTATNVHTLHVFDEPLATEAVSPAGGSFGKRLREYLAERRQ